MWYIDFTHFRYLNQDETVQGKAFDLFRICNDFQSKKGKLIFTEIEIEIVFRKIWNPSYMIINKDNIMWD